MHVWVRIYAIHTPLSLFLSLSLSLCVCVCVQLYVATDSNPVNMQTYELCSDMIDVVIDVSCVYGDEEKGNGDNMLGYGRSERKSVYVCV
jgi:hypothetical protein